MFLLTHSSCGFKAFYTHVLSLCHLSHVLHTCPILVLPFSRSTHMSYPCATFLTFYTHALSLCYLSNVLHICPILVPPFYLNDLLFVSWFSSWIKPAYCLFDFKGQLSNQPIKISPSGLYGGLRIADNVMKRVVRTKLYLRFIKCKCSL
jgi:hypothetical protein